VGETDYGVEETRRRRGQGHEFHSLREYRDGDDPRDIHWKSTARLGALIAREYEAVGDRRLWLLLPNSCANLSHVDDVELAISEAASLCIHYSAKGWSVGLCTLDGAVEPEPGTGHIKTVMTHLALLPVHTVGRHNFANIHRGADRSYAMLVRHIEQRLTTPPGTWDRIHEIQNAV
jgi:uncharacterized protein (DUF58 family)